MLLMIAATARPATRVSKPFAGRNASSREVAADLLGPHIQRHLWWRAGRSCDLLTLRCRCEIARRVRRGFMGFVEPLCCPGWSRFFHLPRYQPCVTTMMTTGTMKIRNSPPPRRKKYQNPADDAASPAPLPATYSPAPLQLGIL
jgi:hypothetical protein